jgi:hypothetical protein
MSGTIFVCHSGKIFVCPEKLQYVRKMFICAKKLVTSPPAPPRQQFWGEMINQGLK